MLRRLGQTSDLDVLDFGCGTGLLTLALQRHLRSVTGADSSAGMLGVLEQKVQALRLTSVTPYLLDDAHPLASAGILDLVASSMTLHHVRDLPALFSEFRFLLRSGGRVALADLDREDGSFHSPESRMSITRASSAATFAGSSPRPVSTILRTRPRCPPPQQPRLSGVPDHRTRAIGSRRSPWRP